MSILIHHESPIDSLLTRITISMDASSSAYQIMSYFLFNKAAKAVRTNFKREEKDKDQI